VAIFVSPLVEKVLYLEAAVDSKTAVDESFQIRDLVSSKKQSVQYLALLLGEERARMYFVQGNHAGLIMSDLASHGESFSKNATSRIPLAPEFSDIKADRFLHHTDEALSLILQAYPFPLFVVGQQNVINQFLYITRNKGMITGLVSGNIPENPESGLPRIMERYTEDWKAIHQLDLLQRLEQAGLKGKLARGLDEVQSQVDHCNTRLLVLEKNLRHYVFMHENKTPAAVTADWPSQKPFYISDRVDEIIERVLESGGEVEFMQEGLLKAYGGIALVKNS
jgi:hypothetical protein